MVLPFSLLSVLHHLRSRDRFECLNDDDDDERNKTPTTTTTTSCPWIGHIQKKNHTKNWSFIQTSSSWLKEKKIILIMCVIHEAKNEKKRNKKVLRQNQRGNVRKAPKEGWDRHGNEKPEKKSSKIFFIIILGM